MTDLPSKDTIEAIEKRIGKWPIKTVLWVLVLTAVISGGGIIVSGLRQSFDLPAFFGPVITGEQRQLKFVVRLRVLPGQREPALPASALRHPSQP